jgi:hypothetical protein
MMKAVTTVENTIAWNSLSKMSFKAGVCKIAYSR